MAVVGAAVAGVAAGAVAVVGEAAVSDGNTQKTLNETQPKTRVAFFYFSPANPIWRIIRKK